MQGKLIELLRESTLVQAVITLVVVGGMVYLYATGQPVPETLLQFGTLVLGFYFGQKTQQQLSKTAR